MTGHSPYAGRRRCIQIGSSVGITFDKQGLEDYGLTREEIKGLDLRARIVDGEFRVDLDEARAQLEDEGECP